MHNHFENVLNFVFRRLVRLKHMLRHCKKKKRKKRKEKKKCFFDEKLFMLENCNANIIKWCKHPHVYCTNLWILIERDDEWNSLSWYNQYYIFIYNSSYQIWLAEQNWLKSIYPDLWWKHTLAYYKTRQWSILFDVG